MHAIGTASPAALSGLSRPPNRHAFNNLKFIIIVFFQFKVFTSAPNRVFWAAFYYLYWTVRFCAFLKTLLILFVIIRPMIARRKRSGLICAIYAGRFIARFRSIAAY